MKDLKNCTISQLVTYLSSLKVEWVGATTRKAPLIELIDKIESLPLVRSESDLPSTMRFVSAPVDSYTWEQLILIWRHFNRGPLTSDEALDRDTLWAKVKALLCSLPGRQPVQDEVVEPKEFVVVKVTELVHPLGFKDWQTEWLDNTGTWLMTTNEKAAWVFKDRAKALDAIMAVGDQFLTIVPLAPPYL